MTRQQSTEAGNSCCAAASNACSCSPSTFETRAAMVGVVNQAKREEIRVDDDPMCLEIQTVRNALRCPARGAGSNAWSRQREGARSRPLIRRTRRTLRIRVRSMVVSMTSSYPKPEIPTGPQRRRRRSVSETLEMIVETREPGITVSLDLAMHLKAQEAPTGRQWGARKSTGNSIPDDAPRHRGIPRPDNRSKLPSGK